MKSRNLIIVLFILVALVQLYVPTKMILDSQNVLKNGVAYKFKAAPVDPNDPFRGKFITLRYKEESFTVSDENQWERKEPIYVVLEENDTGFVQIKNIVKSKPKNTSEFVKATIQYASRDQSNKVQIAYPFDRFYMEESKAPEAERVYNKAARDVNKHTTYAIVYVKDGNAVLDDVMIDAISIKEIVKKSQVLNNK